MTWDDSPGEGRAEAATTQRTAIEITPILTMIATIVLSVAVIVFARRLVDVIGLALAATTLALLTTPVRRALGRWIGDSWSILVTAILNLAVTIGVATLVVRDLGAQAEAISRDVDERLNGLRPGSTVGRIVDVMELEGAIDNWLERIPVQVVGGGEGGAAMATRLLTLLMVVVLAAFLHGAGGSIVDWFTRQWPRGDEGSSSPRAEVRTLLLDVDRRGVGYVRRSLTIAAPAAVVTAIGCWMFGLPGFAIVGVWAGVWFVVPAVGWAVGILPVAALAALDGRSSTYWAVAIAATCAVLAAAARRRYVEPTTMTIGVGTYLLAVALGVAVAGIAGSVVALVAAAALSAALSSEYRVSRPDPWLLHTDDTFTIGALTMPRGWRGILVTLLAVAVGVLAWVTVLRVGQSLTWVLIGSFVAIALSRPAAWIERRTNMPRGVACGVLVLVVGTTLGAIMVPGFDDGAEATTTAADELPGVVAELEDTRVVGGWLENHGAAIWVEDQINDLPQRLSDVRPSSWLPAVGARILDAFWIILLSVALLIDGPNLVDAWTRRVPARHRRQTTRLVGAIGSALGGYAAGAALVASINGGFVFVIAIVLGIGVAPMLAVWAFLWNFVPQIGGFMGGMPLILFALVAGPLQALIATVTFIAYQFVENNIIQPAVIGAAIDVAPWGTLLAALAGAAAAGVVGAIVLTPLVGVGRVIRAEYQRDDFPGATTRTMADRPDADTGAAAARALVEPR